MNKINYKFILFNKNPNYLKTNNNQLINMYKLKIINKYNKNIALRQQKYTINKFISKTTNNLEPVIKLEEPVTNLEEPVTNLEEPVINLEEPVINLEEPVIKLEEPVIKLEEPVIKLEEPVIKYNNIIKIDMLSANQIYDNLYNILNNFNNFNNFNNKIYTYNKQNLYTNYNCNIKHIYKKKIVQQLIKYIAL